MWYRSSRARPAMHRLRRGLSPALLVPLFVLPALPEVAAACACGCGVFEVGTGAMFPDGPGGMAFFEFDFMDQDKNWSGSSQAPAANNPDKRIKTEFMTVGAQYMFNRAWGVQLELPYWHRSFTTTDEDSGDVATFDHSNFGDLRLDVLYTGFSEDMSTGVSAGLKLPTGDSTYPNFDPDTQIGTGSTDLHLGAWHLGRFGADSHWNWLADALFSQPIAHKDSYRPGTEFNAAAGVFYTGWKPARDVRVSPVVELQASWRGHDGGTEGDPDNSGYFRAFVTPGIEVSVSRVKVYVDVSVPFYQHVTGNQLVADPVYKANISYAF